MVTHEYSTKDDRKPMIDLYGHSTNAKPVIKYGSLLIANGSIYREADTSNIYRYDEAGHRWLKQESRIYPSDTIVPRIRLWGLSTDTKPIAKFGSLKLTTGSVFNEMDTSDVYRYDTKTSLWYKQKPISTGGGGGTGDFDVDVVNEALIFTKIEEE